MDSKSDFPVVRIAEAQRKFKSKVVEKLIVDVKKNLSNKELVWVFENAFPNTLDTTVDFEMINGKPDTNVITEQGIFLSPHAKSGKIENKDIQRAYCLCGLN